MTGSLNKKAASVIEFPMRHLLTGGALDKISRFRRNIKVNFVSVGMTNVNANFTFTIRLASTHGNFFDHTLHQEAMSNSNRSFIWQPDGDLILARGTELRIQAPQVAQANTRLSIVCSGIEIE